MIRWVLQGIFRDKSRSLFPFLVVTVGVTLMVSLFGFMEGVLMGMLDMTANLDTGQLRFVNKPFFEEEYLNPMDRSLAAQQETLAWLHKNSRSNMVWAPRIRWRAIMDIPDEKGETISQTPITGMVVDLFSSESTEWSRLKLKESLTEGRLPTKSKEMLVGYQLGETLKIKLGHPVTLLSQSFDGGLAVDNYIVVGFIRFGVFAMDKKMALIDLSDAQDTFYMQDMVTDWLGYLPVEVSFQEYPLIKGQLQDRLKQWELPKDWASDDDPVIKTILDQRGIGGLTRKFLLIQNFILGVFTFLMALVLWNAGVLNGIHRYGEMGLRLAFGESHKQLYMSLFGEAVLIGILGSVAGCFVGGAFVYYLQEVGINMEDSMAQSGLMLTDIARGRISVEGFIHGIIPGLTANVLGTLVAATSIFKRSEANLFRELEVG